jgi:hypothetical protein
MLAATVYILCMVTSLLCAVMLARGYLRSRARLLLWSSLCFVFLSLNNVLLFIDLAIFPETTLNILGIDFLVIRNLLALTGLVLLVFGLIWDSK